MIKIYIYQSIDQPIFLGDFLDYLIENKDNDEVPRIWSISYDSFDIDDYRDKLKELIKTGYQIFNSSGDNGASTLDISSVPIAPGEPSSSPYITSVGGTKILKYTSNDTYIEVPSITFDSSNNLSNNITTGGGFDGVALFSNGDIKVEPIYRPNDDLSAKNQLIKNYILDMSNNGTAYINNGLINKIYDFDVSNNYYPRLYPNVSFSSANYPIYLLQNLSNSGRYICFFSIICQYFCYYKC